MREKTLQDVEGGLGKEPASLFSLAKDSLTVALLRVRGGNPDVDAVLLDRIKQCRGVELAHLQAALPDSGLKAHTLRFLEAAHPELCGGLSKHWRRLCALDFGRNDRGSEDEDRLSWRRLYGQLDESDRHRVQKAAGALRQTYREEEQKVHQLKMLPGPLQKRVRTLDCPKNPSSTVSTASLMHKARREAIVHSAALNSRPSASVSNRVTFRMKTPSMRPRKPL